MKSFIYFFAILFGLMLVRPLYSQVPTDGLIRYYPFSGNANDIINNQNGTVNNATLTIDRYNNPNSAYQFNGTSSHIRLPMTGLFLNNYTYSAWVKLDSYPLTGSLGCILSVGTSRPGNSSGGDQFIGFFSQQLGRNGFGGYSYYLNSAHYLAYVDSSMTLQKWYLVTITRSNNKFNLYVNCNLIMTDSSENTRLPIYGNNPMAHIGMRENNIHRFNGVIDEVRIYNRVLTSEEVLAIFLAESAFTCEDICIEDVFKTISICEGDSIQIGSNYYNSNVTVIDTIRSSSCDSIITTQIKLFPSFDTVIYTRTCNPADTGIFIESLKTKNNCDSIFNRIVSLKTVPIAQIIGENEKCVGESLFLSVELQQPIDSVLWLNNESNNSTIEINEGGNYIVKVFNECGEDFDSIEVKEIDCRCKYFIPNAFAPSGNKIEDAHFQIRTENIESVFVQVYSRWGEKVFESNDLNFKWDGFYRGQLMTTNVFGYYMELQCSQSNEIIIEKGNITLIR